MSVNQERLTAFKVTAITDTQDMWMQFGMKQPKFLNLT